MLRGGKLWKHLWFSVTAFQRWARSIVQKTTFWQTFVIHAFYSRCVAIQPKRRISLRSCRCQSILPDWYSTIFIHLLHRSTWKQQQHRTSTLGRLSLWQACPRQSVARSGELSWNIKRQLKFMCREWADPLQLIKWNIYETKPRWLFSLCITRCRQVRPSGKLDSFNCDPFFKGRNGSRR